MMMYVVHGLSDGGRNVVGCYGLFPDKRGETYIEFISQVQELTGGAVPTTIMTDFELGAINTFKEIYPNVRQSGCHFHLSQNIQKQVKLHELSQLYENDDDFRKNIKMISALA